MTFLEMSFAGAVMILAITVIRAIGLNRLPKKTFILLWEAAMLRLMIPFSISSAFSVYTLFRRDEAPQAAPDLSFSDAAATYMPMDFWTGETLPTAVGESAPEPFPVWTAVWIVGMCLTLFGFAAAYWCAFRKFRCAEAVRDGYAAEWLKEQRLIRKVKICRLDGISSPLTYGVIRPVILLPKNPAAEDPEQLSYILSHELTHIKRFDMLRKLAAAAVLCVHWFNPAVWVLYLLLNRDIELACDEAVVRKTGSRSAYAEALIQMEEKRSISSLYSNFSKNAIEERIVAIMKTKKIGLAASAAASAAVIGVMCVFATSAAEPSEKSKTESKDVLAAKASVIAEETLNANPDLEWYTYDEYKAWIENEKIELQKLLGTKAKTGSRGEFVWTQQLIDETIAQYEALLEQIEDRSIRLSKITDGVQQVKQEIDNISDVIRQNSDAVIELSEKEEILKRCGAYGLSQDQNGNLLYNGETVRFFCDGVEVEEGCWATYYVCLNEAGTVDVFTKYEPTENGDGSIDPHGKLVGLEKADPKEFENGELAFLYMSDGMCETEDTVCATVCTTEETAYIFDLHDHTGHHARSGHHGHCDSVYYTAEFTGTAVAAEDEIYEGAPSAADFEKYQKFGIEICYVYNQGWNITWNGKAVRKFTDISPSGGVFTCESADGKGIDVCTSYDESGRLCGIKTQPYLRWTF